MDLVLAFLIGFCSADCSIGSIPRVCPPGGCVVGRAVPGLPGIAYAPEAAVKLEVQAGPATATVTVVEAAGREPRWWGIIRRIIYRFRSR